MLGGGLQGNGHDDQESDETNGTNHKGSNTNHNGSNSNTTQDGEFSNIKSLQKMQKFAKHLMSSSKLTAAAASSVKATASSVKATVSVKAKEPYFPKVARFEDMASARFEDTWERVTNRRASIIEDEELTQNGHHHHGNLKLSAVHSHSHPGQHPTKFSHQPGQADNYYNDGGYNDGHGVGQHNQRGSYNQRGSGHNQRGSGHNQRGSDYYSQKTSNELSPAVTNLHMMKSMMPMKSTKYKEMRTELAEIANEKNDHNKTLLIGLRQRVVGAKMFGNVFSSVGSLSSNGSTNPDIRTMHSDGLRTIPSDDKHFTHDRRHTHDRGGHRGRDQERGDRHYASGHDPNRGGKKDNYHGSCYSDFSDDGDKGQRTKSPNVLNQKTPNTLSPQLPKQNKKQHMKLQNQIESEAMEVAIPDTNGGHTTASGKGNSKNKKGSVSPRSSSPRNSKGSPRDTSKGSPRNSSLGRKNKHLSTKKQHSDESDFGRKKQSDDSDFGRKKQSDDSDFGKKKPVSVRGSKQSVARESLPENFV